jgi:uncharacterized coiled-coil protein SlyX
MMIIRIAAGVSAVALTAQVLFAQQPGPPQPPDQRPGMSRMAEHTRMMDSLNARLDTLVNRMNRASGNRKVTAMADVLNELVAQRKTMQEHMRQMMESRQGMMMHMMGDSAPAQGRRPPTSRNDSAAADTGHAAHHPPK